MTVDDPRIEQNCRGHVGQRPEEGYEQRFYRGSELALGNDQLCSPTVQRSLPIGNAGRRAVSHSHLLLEPHELEEQIDLRSGLLRAAVAAGGSEVCRNQPTDIE